jgi:hypothetical protein
LKDTKNGSLPQAVRQPRKISVRTAKDRQHQELGNLVRVQAGNRRFHVGDEIGAGFDQHEYFARGVDLALPAVNRLHAGQDIDAGGHLLLDQAMGDALGLFVIGAGGKNNLKISHMFTNYGSFNRKRENFP